jgi:hypothetical protein
MVVVSVILGFIIGTSVGSSLVVIALSGARNSAYWSFVQRHRIIEPITKLWVAGLVVACGVMFAYLGFVLAG